MIASAMDAYKVGDPRRYEVYDVIVSNITAAAYGEAHSALPTVQKAGN